MTYPLAAPSMPVPLTTNSCRGWPDASCAVDQHRRRPATVAGAIGFPDQFARRLIEARGYPIRWHYRTTARRVPHQHRTGSGAPLMLERSKLRAPQLAAGGQDRTHTIPHHRMRRTLVGHRSSPKQRQNHFCCACCRATFPLRPANESFRFADRKHKPPVGFPRLRLRRRSAARNHPTQPVKSCHDPALWLSSECRASKSTAGANPSPPKRRKYSRRASPASGLLPRHCLPANRRRTPAAQPPAPTAAPARRNRSKQARTEIQSAPAARNGRGNSQT